MATTGSQEIRYPLGSDNNDAAQDMQNLAEDVDALLDSLDADHTASAWGTMGYAEATTDQTAVTTRVDRTGLTVTFTAVAGRRYKTTGFIPHIGAIASGPYDVQITDSSDSESSVVFGNTDSQDQHAIVVAVETGLSGSTTRKIRVRSTPSVTFSASSNYPTFILVEDIGPS